MCQPIETSIALAHLARRREFHLAAIWHGASLAGLCIGVNLPEIWT
jgi:hypothetical protein